MQEIEKKLSNPESWQDPEQFTAELKEKSDLNNWIEKLESLQTSKANLEEWVEIAAEEPTQEVLQALWEQYTDLSHQLNRIELTTLLSAPEDKNDAIIEIHPGAGGTEAQDWAEMLFRMYKHWAEENSCTLRLLDYLPGEETGIKSVTLGIEGLYTYGLLKGEKGIHRLIRISPFDASGRRHTSFASVDVYPDVNNEIDIEVREQDIRVDVFRSSGPGGQSVNTTSSAIRITHLPTGIIAQCQNEKSQHRNRETAFKILRARLYQIELEKQIQDKQKDYEAKSTISWGSQIRTYTLHPHRLVKDHRTNSEESNVDKILDGQLDELIRQYLLFLHEQKEN